MVPDCPRPDHPGPKISTIYQLWNLLKLPGPQFYHLQNHNNTYGPCLIGWLWESTTSEACKVLNTKPGHVSYLVDSSYDCFFPLSGYWALKTHRCVSNVYMRVKVTIWPIDCKMVRRDRNRNQRRNKHDRKPVDFEVKKTALPSGPGTSLLHAAAGRVLGYCLSESMWAFCGCLHDS